MAELYWSTNTHLKYRIHRDFRADKHFVWCSPTFSSAAVHRYAAGAMQPPSSDPCSIYWQLRRAVDRADKHEPKIIEQKSNLKALAVKWFAAGEIREDDRDEILAMVDASTFADFTPLLYVIPAAAIGARAKVVPVGSRAGSDREYIIADLDRSEFEPIEMVAP